MRRITLVILLLILAAGSLSWLSGRSAVAADESRSENEGVRPASQTSADMRATSVDDATASLIRSGLWQDGKAVFSDVPLLDIFWGDLRTGYKPKQPIAYSHKFHAGELGIECQYCHSGVHKSKYATIPSVGTCMGCHAVVKKGAIAGTTEIDKIAKHFSDGTPIEWEPVNNLPEHVYFTHERHLKAGVACQTCHGLVQEMDEVEKVASLKMGFCVTCHRENGATTDCSACHH